MHRDDKEEGQKRRPEDAGRCLDARDDDHSSENPDHDEHGGTAGLESTLVMQ